MHGNKGRKQSPEHKEKIRLANLGKKRSDETKRKLSESHKGQVPSENARRATSERMKGNKYGSLVNRDEEYKANMRLSIPGGETHHFWKGGAYNHWHGLAKKQFGKNYCEICNISNEESQAKFGRGLGMHCTGSPRDYTLMEESNWMTLCNSCHAQLEWELGNLTGIGHGRC
jgi:hypothetical protein